MNVIRYLISGFMSVLLSLAAAGWIWAGGLPSAKAIGARVVLTICVLCAIGCLRLLWSEKPARTESP